MDIEKDLLAFVRDLYKTQDFIPLHEPRFIGNENKYVLETLESTFVSSVGQYVNSFENGLLSFTGATSVVATSSGSSALHTALYLSGVTENHLVITPSLTFVSACNGIKQLGAEPIFADISEETLGLCPMSVDSLLSSSAYLNDAGQCVHKDSQKIISTMLPMHTFGHPVDLDGLMEVAKKWNLIVVEDAAESLGSLYKGQHTGTFGRFGIVSFNGNKIITTGGGGAIFSESEPDGVAARHISSTARVKHAYKVAHDEFAFNYRMPNINAALGCGQLENLEKFVCLKRELAHKYNEFFDGSEFKFVKEPKNTRSNYWLNAILCEDSHHQNELLSFSNELDVMTRPPWEPMHTLPMFEKCYRSDLSVTENIAQRLVNLPSSPILNLDNIEEVAL